MILRHKSCFFCVQRWIKNRVQQCHCATQCSEQCLPQCRTHFLSMTVVKNIETTSRYNTVQLNSTTKNFKTTIKMIHRLSKHYSPHKCRIHCWAVVLDSSRFSLVSVRQPPVCDHWQCVMAAVHGAEAWVCQGCRSCPCYSPSCSEGICLLNIQVISQTLAENPAVRGAYFLALCWCFYLFFILVSLCAVLSCL